MEQTYSKLFWKAFDSMMASGGWEKRILFMHGVQWIKGDNEILYDRLGWHLNGKSVSENDILQFL